MGVKCPYCQAENDSGVVFCYQCGTEISSGVIEKNLHLKSFPKVDLKEIMKTTLKKMVTIAIMMFLMILFGVMLTDLLRK